MTYLSLTPAALLSAEGGGMSSMMLTLLILAAMYFLLFRPSQNKDKKANQMRASIEVGDEVITRGGVIGRVCSMKEDTLMIETGADRTRLRVARWAVEERTGN